MSYIESFKKLGRATLDLVFPISCLVCGRDGTYLCESCLTKLPKLEKQICLVCQKPAPFGKTHPTCVSRNTVDGAVAGLSYKDPKVNEIIRMFKYNFVSDLAKPLSLAIIQAMNNQGLNDYFQDFTIVPVPLHKRRYNWRGFNQSDLLSTALAEKLNIPVKTDLVMRRKFTQPQTKLSASDRKKNLENAFELTGNGDNPDTSVGAMKILLLDDVVTSGATANELAKLLKRGKASEVWIISAAHG